MSSISPYSSAAGRNMPGGTSSPSSSRMRISSSRCTVSPLARSTIGWLCSSKRSCSRAVADALDPADVVELALQLGLARLLGVDVDDLAEQRGHGAVGVADRRDVQRAPERAAVGAQVALLGLEGPVAGDVALERQQLVLGAPQQPAERVVDAQVAPGARLGDRHADRRVLEALVEQAQRLDERALGLAAVGDVARGAVHAQRAVALALGAARAPGQPAPVAARGAHAALEVGLDVGGVDGARERVGAELLVLGVDELLEGQRGQLVRGEPQGRLPARAHAHEPGRADDGQQVGRQLPDAVLLRGAGSSSR